MAKKTTPIITQTEILAIAGRSIQGEILKLRQPLEELRQKADTPENQDLIARFTKLEAEQEEYHMKRLEAIETMYLIQTGTELGLTAEL